MRKLVVLVIVALSACGRNGDDGAVENGAQAIEAEVSPSATDIARAAELVPADEELAAKYDRSCRSCHSTPDAAAPLTGHAASWDIRFAAKGNDGLLNSTKAGLNAMPPMGLCNDCTDEELNKLTAFMAGRID